MTKVYEPSSDLQKQISFVSHEIRNNISICDMYAQILKRKLENLGIENSSLDNALNCISKSLQLIGTNLIDLKSLSSPSISICNLQDVIKNSTELSKAFINDKNIVFNLDIPQALNVYTDENKLTSCIVNIIKNAIEAINSNGYVSLSLYSKDNFAVIDIANNGEPIPENLKNDIFKYGCTTKITGSGYGLCLSKQFFESQKSFLNLLKSDEDETIFEIIIPLVN